MTDGEKLLAYYDRAMERVMAHSGARAFLRWVETRRRPTEADPGYILSEYTFVVSAAGFRESTVKGRFHRLSVAMGGFDPARLKEMSSGQIESLYIEHMLRNKAKARAVSNVIGRYSGRTWELNDLMHRLETTQDVDVLKTLPYIGDALKYHLARNLGLDVAKPDVHMLRLAPAFGFAADNAGVQAMCEYVARNRKERAGAVDFVLWYLTKGEATGDWGV
jgi:hypothetical protein